MKEEQSKLLRIGKLCLERESLVQELRSAAVMDDEGMGGGEESVREKEERLRQIDLELKKLTKGKT